MKTLGYTAYPKFQEVPPPSTLGEKTYSLPCFSIVPIADRLSFYSHPRSITASPGENVVFTCVTLGSPVPTITWLKDGVVDVNGKAKSFVGKESSTSVLMIDSVQDKHAGKYACRAAGPIGSVTSNEAQLSIKGKLSP